MEKGAEWLLLLSAALSIMALGLIIAFILGKGVPALGVIGVWPFVTGDMWMPTAEYFGIWPMIASSVLVTVGALLLGAPVSVMVSLYLVELCDRRIAAAVSFMIELLSAIPSVVYGFFGLATIVPLIDKWSGGYGGNSLLAGILVLAMMVLPTIISISATSLRAVPEAYRDAALALGESRTGTALRVMLPAAKSGVFTGIVLGFGRAIGETMAVILVIGNTPRMPDFLGKGAGALFQSVRTLTGNIAIEMGYASGLHEGALFATAVVLLLFIILVNFALLMIEKKAGRVR